MINYDLNKIAHNLNVENKYMVTLAVAVRARQLSESRARPKEYENVPAEKYISMSLEELEKGELEVSFRDVAPDGTELTEHGMAEE